MAASTSFAAQYFDSNGNLLTDTKAFIKLKDTSTNQSVYSDAALTTPETNPVTPDATTGMFQWYFDNGVAVDVTIKTNDEATTLAEFTFEYPDTLNVADGTVSAPSINFKDDASNLGFYRLSSGAIGVTRGGVLGAVLGAGGVQVADGSASNPGLGFHQDGDTGLHRFASGSIAITCNGGNQVLVTDSYITLVQAYNNTTATAANATLLAANSGQLLRSTSAAKYKKDIEPIDADYSKRVWGLGPIWYRSNTELCASDVAEHGHFGFLADDAAEPLPQLVTFNEEGEVEGFNYDRVPALILAELKRMGLGPEIPNGFFSGDWSPPDDPSEPTANDAIFAGLRHEIDDLKAKLEEMAGMLEEGESEQAPEEPTSDEPPPHIADLFHANESVEEANARLVDLFGSATGRRELLLSHADQADREGNSQEAGEKRSEAMDLLLKAERYESAIKWNRGRMAETI
ncbi:MAG: hypothetical protein AAGK02_09690 [Pseudomonadota bacterium]